MIATIISHGKIVIIEEVQLTFHTTQESLIQALIQDQHPEGERAFLG